LEYLRYPLLLFKVNTRMMVGQLELDIFIADLAFHLNKRSRYMCADVEGGIIEDLLLEELLLLILVHIFLQKVERGTDLFHLYRLALPLLLLEDRTQVGVFSVVSAALHR
jgi:hypothetical protein